MSARFEHTLTYDVARDRLVAIGGQLGSTYISEIWEWDNEGWHQRSKTAPAMRGHAAAYDLARRHTVIFGGRDDSSLLGATSTWDGQAWRTLQPLTRPLARRDHAMAYDIARGVVVLFGGSTNSTSLDDTWEWDGKNWTRRSTSLRPPASTGHAMSYDVVRRVTVLVTKGQTWEWDGTSWKNRAAAIPPLVQTHMAYDLPRRETFLFGRTDTQNTEAQCWVWNGTQWRRVLPRIAIRPRNGSAMAYDSSRRRVRLFSGVVADPIRFLHEADLYEWNGQTWSVVAIAAPRRSPQVIDAEMAYDARRDEVLMFGGNDGRSPIDDMWRFDGRLWHGVATTAKPARRDGHAMCDDGRRVLLFGGQTTASSMNDTWAWDGQSWQELKPAQSPPKRESHAIAYDRLRKKVVIFGGRDSLTTYRDTWEWDPQTDSWTQIRSANAPAARGGHAMAFDASLQRVVLFGGSAGRQIFADTWLWDGKDWTQRITKTSPQARHGHAMAEDRPRSRTLLFGGTTRADTWSFDGTDWKLESPGASTIGQSAAMTYVPSGSYILRHSAKPFQNDYSTWMYSSEAATSSVIGAGCAGIGKAPRLAASVPMLGSEAWLDLASDVALAPGVLALAPSTQSLGLGGGCTVYLKGALIPIPLATNGFGFAGVKVSLPSGAAWRGVRVYAQGFVVDARAAVLGLAFSPGLRLGLGD